MAKLTALTDDVVEIVAGEFGLGAVFSWRALDAGTINSNFALHTTAGRFFLRVNEGKSEADVRYEAELIAELAAYGVRTPLPWRSKSDTPYARLPALTSSTASDAPSAPKWVSVFEWVAGEHRDRGEMTTADVEAVGSELARLHIAGRRVPDSMGREGIYSHQQIVQRFEQRVRPAEDEQTARAIEIVADEIEWLAERAHIREQGPTGIIHGDLFRDNALFHDQGVTFLDFEQASSGSFVYDLAVCLNAWCYDESFEPRLVRSLVGAYNRERGASDLLALGSSDILSAEGDLACLYVEARAAAMRFTVTRITDVYLAGSTRGDKDFRRYLARLEKLRDAGGDEFARWARAK